MPLYRFCRPDDLPLIITAMNACYFMHYPDEPTMVVISAKRDTHAWIQALGCQPAFQCLEGSIVRRGVISTSSRISPYDSTQVSHSFHCAGSWGEGTCHMRFEKHVTVDVPRQVVWDFLWDVPRLAACVPGCAGVEAVEPARQYQATISDKVGPFKLRVPLAIEVLEATAPERLRARASGKDAAVQSLVKVELALVLVATSPQTTALQFHADVAVLGKLGTLGHSVIIRRGEAIIEQFVTAMQGLGSALFEALIVQDGQLLNPSLIDYRLPTMADLPGKLQSILVENANGPGPYGAKGVGESGMFSVAPAIGNAIAHAVGVRLTELPLTPERVLHACRTAQR